MIQRPAPFPPPAWLERLTWADGATAIKWAKLHA